MFTQINYNSPITSKLLLEAGVRRVDFSVEPDLGPNVTPDIVSIFDAGTSLIYGNYHLSRPSRLHEPADAAIRGA